MVEPEVAFLEIDGLMDLAEEFVCELAARVLDRCQEDLKRLERDTSKLTAIQRPFPRFNYRDAVETLRKKGFQVSFGDDFGGDEETALAADFDRPIMVTRYPVSIKATAWPDPKPRGRARPRHAWRRKATADHRRLAADPRPDLLSRGSAAQPAARIVPVKLDLRKWHLHAGRWDWALSPG
jgi:hypothetical protein